MEQRQITDKRTKMRAWDIGPDEWNIATDNGCIEVLASAKLVTTRTKKDDWSGRHSFRVVTKTEAMLTVRLGYQVEYTISEPIVFYGGPVNAIRELFRYVSGGHAMTACLFDLEREARRLGITELAIMDARYDWRGNKENRDICARLHRLVQERQTLQECY